MGHADINPTNAFICVNHFTSVYSPSNRLISALHRVSEVSLPTDTEARMELDSHADTCVGGSNTAIIGPVQRTVTVSAFAPGYGSKSYPLATVGTVWIDPETSIEYLLVINQAIYLGDELKHSLLNPNQLRTNGVQVDECPRQFDRRSTHSIMVRDPPLMIPLELSGVVSCFTTRKPTQDEIENLQHVTLTGTARWNPESPDFQCIESLHAPLSTIHEDQEHVDARYIGSVHILHSEPVGIEDEDLHLRLISTVHVSLDEEVQQDMRISSLSAVDHHEEDILFQKDVILKPRNVSAVVIEGTKPKITPEALASSWKIGIPTAKRTLKVTTQAGLRNIFSPSERKVRLKAPWLKFPAIKTRIFGDTMFSKIPSIHREVGSVVFTDGKGFDSVYPIMSRNQYGDKLMSFIHDFGVPTTLVTDGASEMQRGRGQQIANEYHVNLKVTVPYSPWQNKAEASVRENKRFTRKILHKTKAPLRLWSYASKWGAAIRRLTALDIPELDGRTPYEHVTGSTPNITPYAMFDWYQPVYFHQPVAGYPHQKRVIGRLIGVADNCTDELAYVILPKTGRIQIRKSVWAVEPDEFNVLETQADILEYDKVIQERFGDKTLKSSNTGSATNSSMPIEPTVDELPPPPPELFEGDEDDNVEPFQPNEHSKDADGFTPEAMDEYLTAELLLPHGDTMQRARVVTRHKDEAGLPIGRRHENPILDSRLYDVEFPDGSTDVVAANLIAENLYSQIDEQGHHHQTIKEIIDHRFTDQVVQPEDGFVLSYNGTKRPKITTKGCDLQVTFTDGSASWVPLRDIKLSNPVEVAEYAVAHKIDRMPCFNWWARKTLKKRDRIIKKVKSRYWKRTHKYGIELPHSVKEALAIDKRTGTTFWADAIAKEMKNVNIAFEVMEDGTPPVGYKEITCHMVFDIKSSLKRKARFVAGGHLTDPPKESVYSSVVTRDSVRIAFTIAALNGLDILAADVQNAYLNAPTKERVWFKAGLEFGPDNVGKPVKVVRALYGLKSSGARWRDHMANTLRSGRFRSCYADPDVWMRKNRKPDGTPYWEYVLCYVDDVLAISHDPQSIMDYLNTAYTLKPDSIKPPDEYLGAQIRKYRVPGDKEVWAMSSDLYVKRAIADVETELDKIGQKLKTKATTPLSSTYRPELDQSPELDATRANYYQGLIGILRWMVELGRIDIMVAVSMLSRYLVNPRVGHLEEVFHVFAYLKAYPKTSLVFDDTTPVFDETRFSQCDWQEYYPDAKEEEPARAPELLGNPITMTCFVDADHAGCLETRRSHTGVMIFLQKAPIIWYSKRQNTVESSTFGSEFIAMKTAIELTESLRYKIRMMGIPIDGPTSVFCDNEAVFKNATRPESTLKKKHNSIAYHRTREAVAAGIVRIAWEDGRFNLADILTKLMPGPRLRKLISCILD